MACEQAEGIITGVEKRSIRSWRKVERRGHETEEKDEQREKRSKPAMRVERRRVKNGSHAKKAHAK
jgi:hypothetical protein